MADEVNSVFLALCTSSGSALTFSFFFFFFLSSTCKSSFFFFFL